MVLYAIIFKFLLCTFQHVYHISFNNSTHFRCLIDMKSVTPGKRLHFTIKACVVCVYCCKSHFTHERCIPKHLLNVIWNQMSRVSFCCICVRNIQKWTLPYNKEKIEFFFCGGLNQAEIIHTFMRNHNWRYDPPENYSFLPCGASLISKSNIW